MMDSLILGQSGQVASALQNHMTNFQAMGRSELNLLDPKGITSKLDEHRPKVIINAAAYTAVDRAETETHENETLNAEIPGILGQWCFQNSCLLVHYSTDYVFDGSKNEAWLESDPPNPINAYGAAKLQGEQAIVATDCKHLIFRTSWVFSETGQNFVKTMLRLGMSKKELSVVSDQIGAPTFATDIAVATSQCINIYLNEADCAISGIYHMTAQGQTSWHCFAERIFQLMESKSCPVTVETLSPISTAEYPTPATRPLNSILDNTRLKEVFGVELPHWEQGLERCLEKLL